MAMLGCLAALLSFAVRSDAQILLYDDFNDGDAAGWAEFDGEFGVQGGEYVITTNGFCNDGRAIVGDPRWTNYVVDADFYVDALVPGAHAAILFRVESIASGCDAGKYYLATIYPDHVVFCRVDFSGGACTILTQASALTALQAWHHARLVVAGATATLSIDGFHVLSHGGFTEFPAGRIGVKSVNTQTVRYDNITVSGLSAPQWNHSAVNGHWYALTQVAPWTDVQATAHAWSGELATVRNAAENTWIRTAFPSGSLWLGLFQDTASPSYSEPGGGWSWSSGEPVSFTAWNAGSGEPNEANPAENYCEMQPGGEWNDIKVDGVSPGVVEVISPDCNGNSIPDSYEIAVGLALDANANGVIDSCEHEPWTDLRNGLGGSQGVPALSPTGTLLPGAPVSLSLSSAKPFSFATLVVGVTAITAPFKGGTMVPNPDLLFGLTTNFFGEAVYGGPWPAGVPAEINLYFQWWIQDAAAPLGFAASNAVEATTP